MALPRRACSVCRAALTATAPVAEAVAESGAAVDEAAAWERFVQWITARGGNLAAVTLGRPHGLRGLVATRDIAEGEAIVEVPLTAAIELADDSAQKDPSAAALTLLRLVREGGDAAAYFDLFPGLSSPEMSTMPDFFSEEELEMLQHPPTAEKARRRRQLCQERAQEFGLPVEDVVWALCSVVQRSFTVLSPIDGVLRLLLPGIDMFNHDADALHRFRVTWNLHGAFYGLFKVVAGAPVRKGEEVTICYGGNPHRTEGCSGECSADVAWTNDQYLQRYGFVDTSIGSTMVDGRWLASDAAARVREALARSSAQEDKALLRQGGLSAGGRAAVSFRLHLKRALAAQREAQARRAAAGEVLGGRGEEAKPHILPPAVKEQLRRAGVAFAAETDPQGAGAAAAPAELRQYLLSGR